MVGKSNSVISFIYFQVIAILFMNIMLGVSFVFYLFHLTETHLLAIVKESLSVKPFSAYLFFLSYLCLILLTILFSTVFILCQYMYAHFMTDLLLSILLLVAILYLLPTIHSGKLSLIPFGYATIIHFFCMAFLYCLWLGETIRYHRLF